MYFLNSTTGWVIGEDGWIVKTTSGGVQWIQQDPSTLNDIYHVFFINENIGWVGGEAGLIKKTTDGGSTWTSQASGTNINMVSLYFVDPDNGWATAGDSGIILATQNGGKTWTRQISGVNVQLRNTFFTDADYGWICGDSGVVVHTTDGGINWVLQNTNSTDFLWWIDFVDSLHGFIAGGRYTDNSTIFLKTTNGGTTWITHTLVNAPLFSTDFINPDTGWVSGRSGTILKTTNGGDSWIDQSYDGIWFAQISFKTNNIGYALIGLPTLYCSTDGGNNWFIKDIVTPPMQLSRGWISFGLGSSYFGPALYINLSYLYNNNVFTMRYLKADEFRFNIEGHHDEPALSCSEFGILYGRSFIKDNLVLSLSAGVGYIKGIDRGDQIESKKYKRIDISTIGMPFEASFRFEFGFFGVGGSWYGNLNSKKSFSGGLFEISIGIL
jgi:photosystem II stability/assembly factor-like uncharacterized protein